MFHRGFFLAKRFVVSEFNLNGWTIHLSACPYLSGLRGRSPRRWSSPRPRLGVRHSLGVCDPLLLSERACTSDPAPSVSPRRRPGALPALCALPLPVAAWPAQRLLTFQSRQTSASGAASLLSLPNTVAADTTAGVSAQE